MNNQTKERWLENRMDIHIGKYENGENTLKVSPDLLNDSLGI